MACCLKAIACTGNISMALTILLALVRGILGLVLWDKLGWGDTAHEKPLFVVTRFEFARSMTGMLDIFFVGLLLCYPGVTGLGTYGLS